MKKIFAFFNFLFCISYSFSQNLVPNPDFEIFGIVPCGWTNSASDFDAATNSWTSPTQATPDIFSTLIDPSCSNYQPHSTDPSCNGWQPPHSGNIFAGFYTYGNNGSTWREYLQVQLVQPMDTGHAYKVSMYISLSDNSQYATNNIGVGFSTTLTNSMGTNELGYAPQVNYTNVISDTSNWIYLADTIVPTDQWQYLIIGNFFNNYSTDAVYFNPAGVWDRTYYYVDDVSVEEINVGSFPLFAADDVDICEKFCVNFFDSSTNNPTAWQWIFPGGDPSSSTDQNPSICYTNPGIYDVTLITTSANGTDTLTLNNYITVYPTPPFPTITQVGYTLTSSPASSYQWQFNSVDIPGATDQSYTVLQSGYYTVIVGDSNNCKNSLTEYVLISGINEMMSDAHISIYPNPSPGKFIVEFSCANLVSNETENGLEIKVVNTLGQIVFSSEESGSVATAHWKKEIDLGNIESGIYSIEIKSVKDDAGASRMPGIMRRKIVILK